MVIAILRFLVSAWILALVACSSSSTPSAPTQHVTISATPAAFTFALDNNTPASIHVTRSSGSFSSLALGVADPTIVGFTAPSLSGGTAIFTIIPIAHGSTTVTATDSTGANAPVSVTTATCGRPPSLLGAQQVVPAAGATGVSPSIGTLYFVAYFLTGVGVSGNLHVAVGAHSTLEGGALVAATLPPGTTLPTPLPISGATGTIVSATIPALTTGQTYTTQLYNDTCQPAVLAGTFST